MDVTLNDAKVGNYFNLNTLGQTERNTQYKTEDMQYNNTLPLVSKVYIFGIEIEIENVANMHIEGYSSSYWDVVNDNSLRNNGLEFVSVPLRGDQVEKALTQFNKCLVPQHEFSPRTSVHIHMNVRDLVISEIAGLVLIYTAFEELLFDWAGANRTNNVFCVKLTDTDYIQNYLRFNRDPESVVHNWNKYTALNLHPMETKGTVEFRHMAGTADTTRIVTWVNLLACMKSYAKAVKLPTLVAQIQMLNSDSNYEAFLQDVFGDYAKMLLPVDSTLQAKMENAVSYVKLATLIPPDEYGAMEPIRNQLLRPRATAIRDDVMDEMPIPELETTAVQRAAARYRVNALQQAEMANAEAFNRFMTAGLEITAAPPAAAGRIAPQRPGTRPPTPRPNPFNQ